MVGTARLRAQRPWDILSLHKQRTMEEIPMTSTLRPDLSLPAAGVYSIDPSHSEVGFSVRHLMVSKVRGRFTGVAGRIEVAADPLDSKVDARIETATVHTGDDQRDAHLRSADFFAAEEHPEMRFVSRAVRAADRGRYEVDGDLTIRGVALPVTLAVEFLGSATDPWGGERIGLSATADIDREAWGLTWNQAIEAGGVLVGRTVRVELEVEAVRES
jgi:polyisoprenoid-binding protein YceI